MPSVGDTNHLLASILLSCSQVLCPWCSLGLEVTRSIVYYFTSTQSISRHLVGKERFHLSLLLLHSLHIGHCHSLDRAKSTYCKHLAKIIAEMIPVERQVHHQDLPRLAYRALRCNTIDVEEVQAPIFTNFENKVQCCNQLHHGVVLC